MALKHSLTIPKKPENILAPLSLTQQRLWFIYQLDPQSPAYNIARAWRLQGPLNTQALTTSLNLIVARHEALRTTFREIAGQPVQIIEPVKPFTLQEHDFSFYSPSQLDEEIERFLTDEQLIPFDLLAGPLLRFTLIRCASDDYVLTFTVHHIVFDGTSLKNFCLELSLCYQATLAGQPTPLAPLPIQYQDFAYWQQNHLPKDKLASQLAFWKEQLQGAPLVFELPSDLTRPKENTGAGNVQTFTIPSHVISQLKQLIQPQGVTMFTALLVVFQILLARYTGQRNLLVGIPIAGRTHTAIEALMGFFVNTLVLRMQLCEPLTFHDILKQVRKTCLNAYRHQDVPFEKLVEVLKPIRDPGRHPVVQTIFQLRKASDLQLHFPELTAYPFPVKKRTGNFDLHMVCEETASGLQGFLYYPQALYADDAIARFVKHYQILLEALLANAEKPVSQIPFLTEAEKQQQIIVWHNTTTTSPKDISLPTLFEEQVAQRPEAVAVVSGTEQLTYGQLNARANQLAHYLQRQGIGPEARVGVCLERGLDLIVSLLAILKAGGAYVPLDPSYPAERLGYIMEDAEISLLITKTALQEGLPIHSSHVIDVETIWASIHQEAETNLNSEVTPENLAYVIYTSGSTGKPKGVLISHRGLANIGAEQQHILGVRPDSRVLQFASASFDASVFELVMALQSGATLCMGQEEALQPGNPLLNFLREQAITVVTFPPSVLTTMTPERLPALATLAVAGETCPAAVMDQWSSGRDFFNLYGPTEVTIWATMAQCQTNLSALPPIGKPIANTQVYVLDQTMQLMPIGVPGELYIGGIGLAHGYLHRPNLTAERFVPHVFGAEPGARLYRTGDKVRYRSDGNLEFLGRLDQQIKLRGYRIELGEIETILNQHPHVQAAVILCREDIPGTKLLVAYVMSDSYSLNTATLRTYLQERLPGYMVPGTFVVIEVWPRTPNGKVDTRALPPPTDSDRTTGLIYLAPRTPLEVDVADIFQQILGLNQVGVHDNFFDLGGHSLIATQVVSRLRKKLQVEVTLLSFFQGPTVAELAKTIEPLSESTQRAMTLPLLPCSRKGTVPLSFAQQRLWFLDQLEPGSTAYLMSSAFQISGPLMLKALEKSLDIMIQRHEALRTTFPLIDGEPVQQIAPAWPFHLSVIDLQPLPSEAQEQETTRLLNENAQQPFELAVGPLSRFRVVRLRAEEHLLLITLHHIISDGWSMGIFYRELQTAYTAFCAGQPPTLPELPIQYADYAIWQRTWLQGEQLERQLAYWREQLQEPLPTLTLPLDFPRPAIQEYRGEQVTLQVPPALTERLKTLSQQAKATLFITMLTAFQVVLQRWSGQDEVCVGIPSAGRTHQEIEPVMGFFINTLVVRTDASGHPTFLELLKQVRKKCFGAYAHQDVPFEKLVEELQPARQLNRNPIFDVLFNFVKDMDEGFHLPEVTIHKFSRNKLESKFALTMYVTEQESEIHCRLVYQCALFRAERMQSLLTQYHKILEQLVVAPELSIQSYSLVTDESRAWLPDPHVVLEAPSQDSVLTCIRQWAIRTPNQIAIRHGTATLSYCDMLSQSEACAQALQQQGVGVGDVVAIRGPRSSGLIIAILGVWLAKGIILLLNPQLPPARQRVILEASGAKFLAEIRPIMVPESETDHVLVPCLVIDASTGDVVPIMPEMDEPKPTWPTRAAEGSAYVFFTSGTTGIPKGILGSHQALAHFLAWERETIAIGPEDRVAQFTSVSFDVILRDVFLPLTSGATVCLPPGETGGHELLAWASTERITVIHVVPSVVNFWLATITKPMPLPSLRWVLFAGEPLNDQLLNQWETTCPGPAQFINLYGATETTLAKCWYLIQTDREKGIQPIGRPLPQTQLLVLNEEHSLCGIGEVGELVIRTPFRSLGYLQPKDDIPQRFIPNPYRNDPSDVLYHTGDLGRYRLDGTVDILGRRDDQVKIRGVRVEPQEVTAMLSKCPEVQMCTVLACRNNKNEIALTAYVVAQSNTSLSSFSLRTYLSSRIPDAHIPSQYVLLKELPLNPNGKIDRQALRSLTPTELTNNAYVAPRTKSEKRLTAVWEKMLGQEQIGIHDNFFELGGHSLLAMQIVNRIQQLFHVSFSPTQVFTTPTIANGRNTLILLQTKDSLLLWNPTLPILKNMRRVSYESCCHNQQLSKKRDHCKCRRKSTSISCSRWDSNCGTSRNIN